MIHQLRELVQYRSLLTNLVSSELKLRYRRSVLGFLWTFLNPLLMMLVLSLVFSTVMRFDIKDYAVTLLAGLVPWIFFSQAVNNSLMSIVGKGSLLKKVYIPKAVLPLSSVLATLVNFILSLLVFLGLLVATGHTLNASALFLPVSVVILGVFTLGMALLFSGLHVFFRDFGHMTEVIFQLWFYGSPIIYTVEMLPPQHRWMFSWNPLAHMIDLFRQPLLHGVLPSTTSIATAAGFAVATLVITSLVFLRVERHFVMMV